MEKKQKSNSAAEREVLSHAFQGIQKSRAAGKTSDWITLVFQSRNTRDGANQMPRMRINLQLPLTLPVLAAIINIQAIGTSILGKAK